MAPVSLALNWSPPASSSLFDDVTSPGSSDTTTSAAAAAAATAAAGDAGSPRSHHPGPGTASSRRPSAPAAVAASPSLSFSSSHSSSSSSLAAGSTAVGPPGASTLGVQPPVRSMSASPQPTQTKSYAAAAALSASSGSLSSLSSSSPPHSASIVTATEAIVPPGRAGEQRAGSTESAATQQQAQVGQSIFFPTATANTVTWQQYQQMVSQARQQSNNNTSSSTAEAGSSGPSSAGAPRRRTTSGPQRAPTSFNDAHHQNPLPPLSYAPNTVPSHLRPDLAQPTMVHSNSTPAVNGAAAASAATAGAAGAGAAGAGGYHPYRRTPRSSTTTAAVAGLPQIQFGTMLDSADALALTSPGGSDERTQATSSNGPSPTSASAGAPLSYSSVAAGAMRGPGAPSEGPGNPSNYDSYASGRPGQGRRPSDASSITTPGSGPGFAHIRNTSFSSQISASTERERPGVTGLHPVQPKTPSPLSQQPPAPLTTAQIAAQKKSLPSRLRKAISLSTMSEFGSAGDSAAPNSSKSTSRRGDGQRVENTGGVVVIEGQASDSPPMTPDRGGLGSSAASISSRRSGRPPISGSGEGGTTKRSIFNRKFNASTDNISISSTVSSASVMLRKMGNLGKLARRHSLMGLTNMFKDKDRGGPDGRDGFHTDDFGTMTGSGAMGGDGIENSANQAAGSKVKRGKNKKAAPVAASITHATVELETGGGAMTPAASYVRQHQLQMRQQHESGPSIGSGQGSAPSPGLLARVRNVSTDSSATARNAAALNAASSLAANAAAAAAAGGSEDRNQKMFEKERERLKKQRSGWKKMLPGGGSSGGGGSSSSGVDYASAAQAGKAAQRAQPTGLETYAASDEEQAPGYGSAMNSAYASGNPTSSRGGWNAGAPVSGGGGGGAAASLPNSAAALYGEPPQDGLYDEEDEDEMLEPPHAPYADGAAESGDEYETDSLRHWGEGIERSRASAAQVKSVKSILRAQSAYGPDPATAAAAAAAASNGGGYNRTPSGGVRVRSSSFDATQGAGAPGVPLMSQMSNTTEGTDRMDGLSTARAESPSNLAAVGRSESPAHSRGAGAEAQENGNGGGGSTSPPLASPTAGTTNLGHHSNSSMPTLSLMMLDGGGGGGANGGGSGARGARAPKKRLVFAEAQIYHSTWPAHVYDRRGELATCNRLTPALAQSIKEELNSFKMEEMIVAPSSRIYTHFFV
ncbi:bud neck involved protein [Tilletia horrida]|nr:bud neck involved protein [Tilletia horrida]